MNPNKLLILATYGVKCYNRLLIRIKDTTAMKQRIFVSAMLFLGMIGTGNMNPVHAADKFGSIAYSFSDNRWGYSYDFNTRRAAERAALQYCRDAGGRQCKSVAWVGNGCGALAVGRNDWGADSGLTRQEAERNATNKCHGFTNNCTIKVWFCTAR